MASNSHLQVRTHANNVIEFHCTRCGATFPLPDMWVTIDGWNSISDAFTNRHIDCQIPVVRPSIVDAITVISE